MPTMQYIRGLIAARLAEHDHWGFVFASANRDYPLQMVDLPGELRPGSLIIQPHEIRARDKTDSFWVSFVFLPKKVFPRQMLAPMLEGWSEGPIDFDEEEIFFCYKSDCPDWVEGGMRNYLHYVKTGEGATAI